MVAFSKNFIYLKKDPITLFKIDNFFDQDFYRDVKKLFLKGDSDELRSSVGFSRLGKKTIHPSKKNFNDENEKKIITKLNEILYSKDFFYFMIKNIFFENLANQTNILRKMKYLRFPIIDNKEKSLLDFLFSKISVDYHFSYIKNKGSMWPHVDAQRKYASLMLYFPDEDEKEIEYGTTFWESRTLNYSNKHIIEPDKVNDFKNENKVLYKFPFVSNCMYGFLRNNLSWHTVEPIDVSSNYVRKSINIYLVYNN